MYRELLAFVYLASVVYAFFRLRSLFTLPLARGLFTVLFLLVMLSLPAAEILSRDKGWAWLRPESSFGYYLLAYILYLPMTVLAMDLLLGLNHLLNIIPAGLLHNRGFRTAGLAAVLAAPLAIIIAGSINYNHIRISAYHIVVPRKSSTLEHLKIAMAADFHLGKHTRKSFMPAFVTKIEKLNPDIVLIPGDLFESKEPYEGIAELMAAFRKIKTKYGIYASLGNHDSFRRSGGSDFFEDAGIHLLVDDIVRIDDALYLAGRQRKQLSELLRDIETDLPILLMNHRPSRLSEAAQSPVDIQFSGHTHNGQLFPLNIVRKLQYGLAWGHKKIGQVNFFVTCGIQGWGPRVRTAGHSEIMLIDVDFVK